VRPVPPLPSTIAGIEVPGDDVSLASWTAVHRRLPRYLLAHSVRAFCWGAAIAASEGWPFDRQILWSASLWHDVGLSRLGRNTMCFEVEGAEIAREFVERHGLPHDAAERLAIAIILHMRSNVTLDDGVESVLLDRATGLDVRGDGFEQSAAVRAEVVRGYPRGSFDRHFLAAIRREATARPTCQSARLLNDVGLAGWMARSPWATRPAEGGGPEAARA
jgi:HD domain-containing protein